MGEREVVGTEDRMWLADGIVRVAGVAGSEQTRAYAEEAVAMLWKVAGGTKRPALVDLRRVRSIDREARTYYAGPATVDILSAIALLTGSPLTRVLGNFMIGLNKSVVPTRMFTSESEALTWLRGYVEAP